MTCLNDMKIWPWRTLDYSPLGAGRRMIEHCSLYPPLSLNADHIVLQSVKYRFCGRCHDTTSTHLAANARLAYQLFVSCSTNAL